MGKSDFLPSSSMLRVLSEQSGTKPHQPSLPDRHRGLLLLLLLLVTPHTPEGATGRACVPLGMLLGMRVCRGAHATKRPRQRRASPTEVAALHTQVDRGHPQGARPHAYHRDA